MKSSLISSILVLALIIAMSLLLSSVARADDGSGKNPRFHFEDCVGVTQGFFTGCHGLVKDYRGNENYEVYLSCPPNGNGVVTTLEFVDLKRVDRKVCKDL